MLTHRVYLSLAVYTIGLTPELSKTLAFFMGPKPRKTLISQGLHADSAMIKNRVVKNTLFFIINIYQKSLIDFSTGCRSSSQRGKRSHSMMEMTVRSASPSSVVL